LCLYRYFSFRSVSATFHFVLCLRDVVCCFVFSCCNAVSGVSSRVVYFLCACVRGVPRPFAHAGMKLSANRLPLLPTPLCEPGITRGYSFREITPRVGSESLGEKAEGRRLRRRPSGSLRWLPVRQVRASALIYLRSVYQRRRPGNALGSCIGVDIHRRERRPALSRVGRVYCVGQGLALQWATMPGLTRRRSKDAPRGMLARLLR
jgi:hypothetical protein